MNTNKTHPIVKMNIPKTPQQVFLKKHNEIKNTEDNNPTKSIEVVKHIDQLYKKTFVDEYFIL